MHRKGGAVSGFACQPELEGQAGHAIDAAISRGDQRHLDPLAGQLQGLLAALPLLGELAIEPQLIRSP